MTLNRSYSNVKKQSARIPCHFIATETSRLVLMGGASLPTQDGCCLDPWIVNIDCARASVRVLRKVETDATFVMTC